MLEFDPKAPYPLLELDSYTYAEAQTHAIQVDQWLGLNTHAVETALADDDEIIEITADPRQEVWIGLHVPSLQTPYAEIRSILALLPLQPRDTVIDLGAGYGRMAFVIGRHYPEVRFLGYELLRARVNEAQRCLRPFNYPNVQITHADLIGDGFELAPARFYFLYDYGSREAIEKTLQDIKAHARQIPIAVIARGRSSRDQIERMHPWLSGVVTPEHHPNFSIYRSK